MYFVYDEDNQLVATLESQKPDGEKVPVTAYGEPSEPAEFDRGIPRLRVVAAALKR